MRRLPASVAFALSAACSTPSTSSETSTGESSDTGGGPVPCQTVGDWGGGCCMLEYPCDAIVQTCSNPSDCTADAVANPDAVRCVFEQINEKNTFSFEVQRPAGGDIQSTTTYWLTGDFFVAWESGSMSGTPLDDWFTCRKAVGPIATPCASETDPAAALDCIKQVCADFAPLGSCDPDGSGTTTTDGSTGDGDGDSATGDGDGCVFVCGDEGGDTATTGPIPDAPDLPDPCDNLIEYACPDE